MDGITKASLFKVEALERVRRGLGIRETSGWENEALVIRVRNTAATSGEGEKASAIREKSIPETSKGGERDSVIRAKSIRETFVRADFSRVAGPSAEKYGITRGNLLRRAFLRERVRELPAIREISARAAKPSPIRVKNILEISRQDDQKRVAEA